MEAKYVFKFSGTREAFFELLNQYPNNDRQFYYFNGYIVKIIDDKIHFGIERCGHSGGNWFLATITEFSDCIVFSGKIEYIGPKGERNTTGKAIDKVEEFLLFVFLLPIVFVFKFYKLIEWCIRKIRKSPKPREETTEDKLYDLMENYLKCVRL